MNRGETQRAIAKVTAKTAETHIHVTMGEFWGYPQMWETL